LETSFEGGSFQWLMQHELVYIYGYVIMPNHIHVLWEQLKMNGKETPLSWRVSPPTLGD